MVKRTLIAIAVAALLATSVQAGLNVYTNDGGKGGAFGGGAIKTEGSDKVYWPWEYKAQDLCSIPVTIEIGFYVDIEDCDDAKIALVQVDCDDLSNTGKDWPCYMDCETVTLRTNFEVKLGLEDDLEDHPIIKKADVYIKGGRTVYEAGEHDVTICVEAWDAQLWKASGGAGTEETVGHVTITVKPNA